jgi:DNA-binding NarL/FixJ family response regulator
MKTILMVEDDSDVRNWLSEVAASAFEDATIHEASTVSQALAHLKEQNFDLAILDFNLPDGNAIDIIREIKSTSPGTYCVIATIFDDDRHVFDSLRAGAQGYLLKEQNAAELAQDLRGILSGNPPISPPVARRIIRYFNDRHQDSSSEISEHNITKRESQILTMVAKGMSRSDIAASLNLSPNTVATHIKSIYRKLDISSKPEATMKAISLGLIEPD